MTNRHLVGAAIAAGLIALTTAAWAASACTDLVTNPNTGQTLRRCTAANGESYCELCKNGQCSRTSCAQPAFGGR